LAYLAKWTLRVVFLLGMSLALAGQASAAPEVFTASGEFDNGWALSGTITIDTATGKLLSADLSATNGSVAEFVFDQITAGSVRQIVLGSGRRSTVWTVISIESEHPFGPSLFLTVEEPTLVGYKGSPLYTGVLPGYGTGSGIFNARLLAYPGNLPLLRGSLEPN